MLSRASGSLRSASKGNVLKTLSCAASTSTTTHPITSNHIATPMPAGPTPSTPVVGTQAPNHPSTWSNNQRTRPTTGSGPRFEQVAMELQPNPLSAMAMIAEEPIRVVEGRKAVCDGGMDFISLVLCNVAKRVRLNGIGSGPLGHPKIYINLVRSDSRMLLGSF
ncbi:hypothetical protein J3R30DRAFT_3444271 [Lentinula aciculospora]|uniref:Uncharacterized protein n=1 Tax=Lentinula aciculospora TaxID=153920 RepID=A0A9W9AQL6_9AGAR|nr:hypothetical protein J3R30DRAFT_3444271 [Lentinula aciculospora]